MISVLYVDDEPGLLEIGKEFLEQSGSLRVRTVLNASEALNGLSANHYDLVVSDYQMPGMNGIELLKCIRKNHGDLPFILFTGKGREEVVIEALNYGADFYLQKGGKPVPQFAELEHKIKLAVQQRRSERQIAESEGRYRALFENASDAIFLMDKDVIIDCNKKASDLFLCDRKNLIGTRPVDHSPEFQPDGLPSEGKNQEFVQKALSGKSGIFEWRHRRSDGTEFDADTSLCRLDIQGQNLILSIVRDVSERRQMECALRESAQLMTDIISFLPDATFAINTEGIVIAWNHSMEQMTGIPASDIIGKGQYEYALPFYGERRPILIDLILADDEGISQSYDTIDENGLKLISERFIPGLRGTHGAYLWFTASPLLDSHGNVIGAIESIRDISQHKERELELRASLEQVSAMEEELRNNFEELAAREQALARNERKFRALFSNMVEGNAMSEIIRDESGLPCEYRILEVNPAFEKIFGIRREDAVGRLSRDAFGRGEPSALERYARVADSGVSENFEIWYPPMQKYFAISVYSPAKGTFATVFEDITERKRKTEELMAAYEQIAAVEEELRNNFEELAAREQALRSRDERYRRIVETANEGIWEMDADLKTTYVNKQLAEMLGYSPDLMTGHTITEFMAPAEHSANEVQIRHRKSGESGRYERCFRGRNGNNVWCIVSATPLFGKGGEFAGSFAMLTDITRRKEIELDLNRRIDELSAAREEISVALEELRIKEEALAARNLDLEKQKLALADAGESLRVANRKLNLLSDVTRHDVLNQLMILDGFVELSRQKIPDGRMRDIFEKEDQAIEAIRRQISFTKQFEEIGVDEPAWQNLKETLEHAATGAYAPRVFPDASIAGLEIYADPLLQKVFYNLIDNAMRHGGNVTRIDISCARIATDLIITVRDDGVGVDPEAKANIFDKGFGKNTGFGLFLAREILQITGLCIRERGTPSRGAEFEIIVPDGAFRFRKGTE